MSHKYCTQDLRPLRLPQRQVQEVRLVCQGPQEDYHRHRQDEAPLKGQEEVQGRGSALSQILLELL